MVFLHWTYQTRVYQIELFSFNSSNLNFILKLLHRIKINQFAKHKHLNRCLLSTLTIQKVKQSRILKIDTMVQFKEMMYFLLYNTWLRNTKMTKGNFRSVELDMFSNKRTVIILSSFFSNVTKMKKNDHSLVIFDCIRWFRKFVYFSRVK